VPADCKGKERRKPDPVRNGVPEVKRNDPGASSETGITGIFLEEKTNGTLGKGQLWNEDKIVSQLLYERSAHYYFQKCFGRH